MYKLVGLLFSLRLGSEDPQGSLDFLFVFLTWHEHQLATKNHMCIMCGSYGSAMFNKPESSQPSRPTHLSNPRLIQKVIHCLHQLAKTLKHQNVSFSMPGKCSMQQKHGPNAVVNRRC